MNRSTKFSPEVREHAVRTVWKHRGEYPLLRAAIELTVPKVGCIPQTLRRWVRHDAIKGGKPEGVTTSERIGAMERDVKELRRANDVLKAMPPTRPDRR